MGKYIIQWASVGILSLVGWGVDLIPGNTSWVPSATIWSIAIIWLIGTLIYYLRHKNKTNNFEREQPASISLSNKGLGSGYRASHKRTGIRMQGGRGKFTHTKIQNMNVGIETTNTDLDAKDTDIK